MRLSSTGFYSTLKYQTDQTNMACMKKTLTVLLLLISSVNQAQDADLSSPKLTVLIGIDQFRSGYLERYNKAFSGGFRRMLDTGTWYPRAIVDHAPTLSLPGHTTLATGANPSNHGITSNAWLDPASELNSDGLLRATIPWVDFDRKALGDDKARAYTPHHILVDCIADWFKEADQKSKTVALSVTGLAALYGGRPSQHSREDNHVYWLGSTGKFVTSDLYRDSYPDWIDQFNKKMAQKYVSRHVWNNSTPEEFKALAREDNVDYEFDGVNTSFPHTAEESARNEVNQDHYNWWFGRYSPYQNEALFDLAMESVARLQLGQREAADLLSIAVKLTDRIGHDFGPRSMEQLDVVLRLDRLLGDLFAYLDKTVGKDNYVIALSADHGGPNSSEHEQTHGREAPKIRSEDFAAALESVASLVHSHADDKQALPSLIAANLESFAFIGKAMSEADLRASDGTDPVISAYRNSYRSGQPTTYPLWTRENQYGNLVKPEHPANYGVVVELVKNANIWTATSTHGGSHQYDREVPILFMGPGIKNRVAKEKAYTRDVAPTLATLAGITYPATVDGRVLDLD